MSRFNAARGGCMLVLLVTFVSGVMAQDQREEFTNLKVLPKNIAPDSLRAMMNGFTRALGVRCIHCHVGEEGKPFKHEDFAKDDKSTKLKAREMMRMTQDLNDKYLANLTDRADPPIRVQCFTCHHGVTRPRTLQDVLETAYSTGGMDSTLARYQALRGRYYGSAAYDFGEVPLADLAGRVRKTGHPADAERLLALDVEKNPESAFARRQHAGLALTLAFSASADSGAAAYRAFSERYGAPVVNERLLNGVAYDLLGAGQTSAAVAAFKFNVTQNPNSANAYDSMGEALLKQGDRKAAIVAYQRSLELDPTNENAVQQLAALKVKPKSKRGKK